MNIRLEVIALILFGIALYINPEIPTLLVLFEQLVGWIWVGMVGVALFALHFNMNSNKKLTFSIFRFLYALFCAGFVIYSGCIQGFVYLSGALLVVTILFWLRIIQLVKLS